MSFLVCLFLFSVRIISVHGDSFELLYVSIWPIDIDEASHPGVVVRALFFG